MNDSTAYRAQIAQHADRCTRVGLKYHAQRSLCPVTREVCAELLAQRIEEGKP